MIYFHIPFCKQACHYCDFHFSTSLKYKEEMLQAMLKELEIRSHYLEDKNITSIYFGGGTPSILEADEIQKLIDKVGKLYHINTDAEITLEANPDDLSIAKVKELRRTDVNRFSIGIQSFFEEDLIWMNRAHNQQEADSSIKRVQDAGFENITCDLIYGYPLLTDEKWKSNINKLIEMGIPHISSYNMTVESKTALAHFVKQGITKPMSDAQGAEQMLLLIDTLRGNGFEHYEISNFAKDGFYAKHNTNYWKGKHYLGIGPSAHSFNGNSRAWNIANNAKYITGIQENIPTIEEELLSKNDQFNEYVMTSLRTMWGIDLQKIEQAFGYDYIQHIKKEVVTYIDTAEIENHNDHIYRLTAKGKLMADHIASELFIVD
ncbi:radical SAM family heme chaperone HemW [Sphingobacterium rhinopitheci]|uniref:radical SAM family heme chaperone HemW n=1 Tax=Sphingobacterium rhinopitheci TaxID=2781960 RepID=UPI001F519283|nr:radical SAM family heme chaperone HemW [Sphingobacterium rhinopitheci]MCI0920559.1 radical SAM family heme chaperone HemW [Sphingobacterium rhinopitheci]